MSSSWSVPEVRRAALSLAAFAVAVSVDLLGAPVAAVGAAYLVCYVAGGWEPAWSGLQALREGRLEVDLLMVVAAVAAAAIGQYFDGGLLIVIFASSGALEAVMTARTRESIHALLDLAPATATRLDRDGERQVPARELVLGDEVLVRPGAKVPADGAVVDGASEVDTASLTGEPLPRRTVVGDTVHAGTINGTGTLRVRVDRDPTESLVAGIAAQVQQAGETKARRQLLIERIEQRYSVLVMVGAVALLSVPLLFGAAFEPTLLRAMTFMIVASPCAVVLATMPPLLAAIAAAGRNGVLVKDATVIEALADVDAVALDKTGTVTRGVPRVVGVAPLRGTSDQLLALAAAAESGSEHALGRAVREEARRRGVASPDVYDFVALPGRGVRARVGGTEVVVGHPALLAADDAEARGVVTGFERAGHTAVVVLADGCVVGVLALADELRPEAGAAIAELTELVGRGPALLTGDAVVPARAVAGGLGLADPAADLHAGLLPAGKTAVVAGWQREGRTVLAVGDGVNDAPLLATADVGLAVEEGASALTVQAADGVLLRDPMGNLAPLITLARRARRVAQANLAFAAAVIVVLVGWDLVGTLPLALGVAGHELSTVLVCLNGLRLLARPGWSPSRPPTPELLPAARGQALRQSV